MRQFIAFAVPLVGVVVAVLILLAIFLGVTALYERLRYGARPYARPNPPIFEELEHRGGWRHWIMVAVMLFGALAGIAEAQDVQPFQFSITITPKLFSASQGGFEVMLKSSHQMQYTISVLSPVALPPRKPLPPFTGYISLAMPQGSQVQRVSTTTYSFLETTQRGVTRALGGVRGTFQTTAGNTRVMVSYPHADLEKLWLAGVDSITFMADGTRMGRPALTSGVRHTIMLEDIPRPFNPLPPRRHDEPRPES